jgi:aminoglycoside phosphotransferase (APT) family kinase protein
VATGDRKLILRVPRWGQKRLDRDVAILNYVRWTTSIPVPKIAATDFSCDNVLQKPYVLQHQIPGKDLNTVWYDLSHLQRCTVAGELGRVIRTLLSLEHPTTGIIEAAPRSKGDVDCFSIVPYELDLGEGEEAPKAETSISLTASRPRKTTLDIFRSQFGRWRTLALKRSCGEIDNEIQLGDSMLRAVLEMENLGLFRPDLNCLCHVDLHSSNIMIEIQSDTSIRLTAVFDWDEAIFAPKFVNCKPPAWLWDDDFEDLLDEDDLNPWPYELDGANALPSSREIQELKRIFEENAGPEYPHLAYNEHSRLCRGLFRVAKDDLNDNANWKAAERILSEWKVIRHSLTSEL